MVKPISLDHSPANQVSELTQQSNLKQINNDTHSNVAYKKVENPFSVDGEAVDESKKPHSSALEVKEEIDLKQKQKELEEAFATVSDFMNLYNRNVNFSQDEKSEKTIIKVYDSDSNELIKQFPSEDLLKVAQKINGLRQDLDLKSGIFLDEKV